MFYGITKKIFLYSILPEFEMLTLQCVPKSLRCNPRFMQALTLHHRMEATFKGEHYEKGFVAQSPPLGIGSRVGRCHNPEQRDACAR